MELVALRTFQAVVEEGGVLAASRKLHTVQSNVTSRIQRLEEELGISLFFRTGRSLVLAPAGRVLLDYARRLLLLERQTAAAIRGAGETTGDLRIGTSETFAFLYLPKALIALRRRHPRLTLRVHADTGAALVTEVLTHGVDCALTAGPVEHADLEYRELVVEELVQVTSRAGDARRLPAILFRDGCAYRARAIAWQRLMGHATSDVMELGTLEGILGCVAAGLGWTLLPRRVVAGSAHATRVAVHPISPALSRVSAGLVRLKAGAASPAVETLAAAIRAAGARRSRAGLRHRRIKRGAGSREESREKRHTIRG